MSDVEVVSHLGKFDFVHARLVGGGVSSRSEDGNIDDVR